METDAVILPVSSIQPYPHNPDHENFTIQGKMVNFWVGNSLYYRIASTTGFPVVTLPIGTIDGIPIGVQILGKMVEDRKLLAITLALENQLGDDLINVQTPYR